MRVGTSTLIGVKEHASVLVLSPNHLYYNRCRIVLQEVICRVFMDKQTMETVGASCRGDLGGWLFAAIIR